MASARLERGQNDIWADAGRYGIRAVQDEAGPCGHKEPTGNTLSVEEHRPPLADTVVDAEGPAADG